MLKKLKARLAAVQKSAQDILADADTNAEGLMTAEQQEEFDRLMADAKKIKAQIDSVQESENLLSDLEETQGRQSAPASPGARNPHVEVIDNRFEDDTRGFADIGEFSCAVRDFFVSGAVHDERLLITGDAPSSPHREAGTTEGFMVPPAFRNEIWRLVYGDDSALMNMVDTEPTSRNSVHYLKDESTPWGATGIQAYWRKEAEKMKESKLDTEGSELKLHELYCFVTATEEIMEDAPRLATRLTNGSAEAIKWKAVESILDGTGVGQPLGYRKSKALITVSKENGQANNTIVAENVMNMYARMLSSGMARAVWQANQDILPQLMSLKIGDTLLWTPPQEGFKSAPGGFLLGKPIMFTEHAESLGTNGDLQLLDPKGYYSPRKKGGAKFAESMHLFFDRGVKAFRWQFRFGGAPFLSKPVTPAKSNNTRSHFITLEDRTS